MKIVKKKWGEERWITNNKKYCGKVLFLKKGYQCSLHFHREKDETFFLIKGRVFLELRNATMILEPRMEVRIRPYDRHRFSGLKRSEIIEFSTPHQDSDNYRLEPSRKIPESWLKEHQEEFL